MRQREREEEEEEEGKEKNRKEKKRTSRLVVDVRRLAPSHPARVVQHHPGVGQDGPFPFRASGEQEPGHPHARPEADSADIRLQVPHRVVERQRGDDLSTCAVDVDPDVLLGLGVEVEHGGDELVGELVVDGLLEEDDTVAVLE